MPRDRLQSVAEGTREPHSVSLKVLRLSRPLFSNQHPVTTQALLPSDQADQLESLSYGYVAQEKSGPFIFSPLLTFPPSFGSAYVGEQFSCCICLNQCNDNLEEVNNVKIRAQIQTPSLNLDMRLLDHDDIVRLGNSQAAPDALSPADVAGNDTQSTTSLVFMTYRQTHQRIVKHDLKEEGNHVLSITISYTEQSKTGGEPRTRTFRKLYQFVVMQCLTVRTKTGELPSYSTRTGEEDGGTKIAPTIILEAQLENMAETPVSLEVVNLHPRKGWVATSLNWDSEDSNGYEDKDKAERLALKAKEMPMLKSKDVMQVAFLLQPDPSYAQRKDEASAQLKIEWRSACGDKGYLSTGYLQAKKKT